MNVYNFVVRNAVDSALEFLQFEVEPESDMTQEVGYGTRMVAVPPKPPQLTRMSSSLRQIQREETLKRLNTAQTTAHLRSRRASSLVYDVETLGGDVGSTPVRVAGEIAGARLIYDSKTNNNHRKHLHQDIGDKGRKKSNFGKKPSWLFEGTLL